MYRILLGIAAAVLLVAVVVLARALLVPKPAPLAPAAPPISVDARSVAQHLGAAVRFGTVSFGGGAHEAEKDRALEA